VFLQRRLRLIEGREGVMSGVGPPVDPLPVAASVTANADSRYDPLTAPSRIQMPRHVDYGDSLRSPSQECSLKPGCALIVEEVLIPMLFYQLGNDHGDLPVRVLFLKIQDVFDNRVDDEAIR
jgi:hypothetical protein